MRSALQFLAMAAALLGLAASAPAKMTITSSAFSQGGTIPLKYTCDAQDAPNPPLTFTGVPANAKTLVLIMYDPDVPKTLMPSGLFNHWLIWDISPKSKGIKEGDKAQGINGSGKAGYYPPCPPDREHRYFFHLYALDTSLSGTPIKNREDLEAAMKGHVIEEAELMARYNRPKNGGAQ